MHSHSELLWQGDLQRLSTQLNPHSVTYLSVLSSRWCHVSQCSALSSASMAKCSICHFLVDPSEHLHPIHTLPHPSTAYISQTTTTNRRSATCDNHHATSPHHSMSFCQQHALLLCHSNFERRNRNQPLSVQAGAAQPTVWLHTAQAEMICLLHPQG